MFEEFSHESWNQLERDQKLKMMTDNSPRMWGSFTFSLKNFFSIFFLVKVRINICFVCRNRNAPQFLALKKGGLTTLTDGHSFVLSYIAVPVPIKRCKRKAILYLISYLAQTFRFCWSVNHLQIDAHENKTSCEHKTGKTNTILVSFFSGMTVEDLWLVRFI